MNARTVSTERDPHGTAMLTSTELESMSGGFCPDCAHSGFRLGPRGGAAINIQCGGCGQLFNVTNLGWEVVMGHRLQPLQDNSQLARDERDMGKLLRSKDPPQ